MRSFPWKWNLADLPKPTRGTVFSCFACGGGSSMGYKRAGFRVLGCVEIDPRIAAVYKRNLHPKHQFVMDLRAFNALPDSAIPDELRNLDVLDGSPPCSTFSMSGKREKAWGKEKVFAEGQAKQRLDDLFFVFLDTVERLRPRVVVAENVTGILKGNARGYCNEIVHRFHDAGYAVQMFVLNAAQMEVPQQRERVFFVANRCGFPKLELAFDTPPLAFGAVKTPEGLPIRTRLGGADNLWTHLGKARPGDTNLSDVAERERGKSVRWNWRMVWDNMVMPTIMATAAIGIFRMPERTRVSLGDLVACGTFPQDYDFSTGEDDEATYDFGRFMIGMSVPPSMMAHIADEIGRQWLDPSRTGARKNAAQSGARERGNRAGDNRG